jgi:hypothetical protein
MLHPANGYKSGKYLVLLYLVRAPDAYNPGNSGSATLIFQKYLKTDWYSPA